MIAVHDDSTDRFEKLLRANMRKEEYDGVATVYGGPDGPRSGVIKGILSPPWPGGSRREPETASLDDQNGGRVHPVPGSRVRRQLRAST
jgi:hypothetical protein